MAYMYTCIYLKVSAHLYREHEGVCPRPQAKVIGNILVSNKACLGAFFFSIRVKSKHLKTIRGLIKRAIKPIYQ
jgi:hypothetical protein